MTKSPLDIIFFATPEFAVPILEQLASDTRFNIRLVVTQPDSPSGRGQRLTPPPIKITADKLGLKSAQPESLKYLSKALTENETDDLLVENLRRGGLSFIVVVAYGKIIPDALLNFLPSGVINVHPSLLPRWRGAAPLQRAIFSGDTVTGTSIMKLDQGLDTGPVFLQEELPITADDNFGTIHEKLAKQGARLLSKSLLEIAAGTLCATPQDDNNATYAEKWEKQDLLINWEEATETTINRIRACSPVPGARTFISGSLIKIFDGKPLQVDDTTSTLPGTIIEVKDRLLVATDPGMAIAIEQVQFPGKKVTTVKALANSGVFKIGEKFSNSQ